jgi:hypothetical protein
MSVGITSRDPTFRHLSAVPEVQFMRRPVRKLSCGHFGKNFFRYSGGERLFVVSSGKARAYNLTRL